MDWAPQVSWAVVRADQQPGRAPRAGLPGVGGGVGAPARPSGNWAARQCWPSTDGLSLVPCMEEPSLRRGINEGIKVPRRSQTGLIQLPRQDCNCANSTSPRRVVVQAVGGFESPR